MAELKILLATTDPGAKALGKSLLARREFRVMGTVSGVEALNKIKFEHPDVAILDYALPDMNGDDVCRDIKGDPDVQGTIVAVAIEAGDAWLEERARAAGADHVLDKPLRMEAVEAWLAEVMKAPLRRAVRVPVRIKVEGASSMGEMRGEAVDLSTSGIRFIMTECDLETGYSLWLKFSLGDDTPPVVCKGTVVRLVRQRSGYEVALRFTSFNGDGAPILRRFLRANGAG